MFGKQIRAEFIRVITPTRVRCVYRNPFLLMISALFLVESLRRTGHLRVNLSQPLTRCGVKGALQLLSKRLRLIRFAQVHERVSTMRFVGLIIVNSG